MIRDREPQGSYVRARNTVIDVGIVLVLAAHVTAFLGLRDEQNQYDGDARAIAPWAQEHDVSRVAWSSELRQAVPALLD